MIDLLILTVILGLVAYRVGRFLLLDTLIDEPRDKAMGWLEIREGVGWRKLEELFRCPWCITIWTAAGATAATTAFMSVPLPVWVWLAAATWALVLWRIIDPE